MATPLTQNSVKGLVGSAGKALAVDHRRDLHLERLEGLSSRQEFLAFLESAPLGMAAPSRKKFIEAVTVDDEWETWRARLAASLDMQIAEFRHPGA